MNNFENVQTSQYFKGSYQNEDFQCLTQILKKKKSNLFLALWGKKQLIRLYEMRRGSLTFQDDLS